MPRRAGWRSECARGPPRSPPARAGRSRREGVSLSPAPLSGRRGGEDELRPRLSPPCAGAPVRRPRAPRGACAPCPRRPGPRSSSPLQLSAGRPREPPAHPGTKRPPRPGARLPVAACPPRGARSAREPGLGARSSLTSGALGARGSQKAPRRECFCSGGPPGTGVLVSPLEPRAHTRARTSCGAERCRYEEVSAKKKMDWSSEGSQAFGAPRIDNPGLEVGLGRENTGWRLGRGGYNKVALYF